MSTPSLYEMRRSVSAASYRWNRSASGISLPFRDGQYATHYQLSGRHAGALPDYGLPDLSLIHQGMAAGIMA